MTNVNCPLVLDVGPPELSHGDQSSGRICNVDLRNSTTSDLFVVLSCYNNNIISHSDEKRENKYDSIINIKVRHSEILANILLKGPPKFTVFRSWPRSPSGIAFPDELRLIHCGKTTPNGLPWGATVFDFYYFALDPSSNIYSGSQLLEWSKAIGEEVLAKDEIEWASIEETPRIIDLYPPSMSVVIQEENIRARKEGWGISMPKDVALESIDCAPDTSIFKPSNYQSPWPLIPFSYPTERLQSHIPIHQLPKKIVVHDPWNLLAMDSQNRYGNGCSERTTRNTDWLEKPDIIHVYNLNLSPAGEARLREELEIMDKQSHFNSLAESFSQTREIKVGAERLHGYFLQSHASTSPGPIAPPIFITHDLPPSIDRGGPIDASPTVQPPHNDGAMEEAHLYLSPAHNAGAGNHSIVYKAEWEVARTTFLHPAPRSPVLCEKCVEEEVKRILAEEDGENGERMKAQWKEKSALLRKVARVVKPLVRVRFARAEGPESDGPKDKADEPYIVYPEDTTYKIEIEGPVRVIRTTIAWQDPSRPSCQHLLSQLPIPPTAKFRVIAKLSFSGDDHLKGEALNYQDFDQHMFQHWSGLNRVSSLDFLSPVGAIVPQFYGYYIPQLREDETDERMPYYVSTPQKSAEQSEGVVKHNRGYLSPILLLEDCGQTIGCLTDKIERNEVFSLVHRFHSADWAHGSIAERNILVQPGPLNVPPEARTGRSFRLIDFGRSIKASDTSGRNSPGYYNGRLSSDKRSMWYL